MNNRQQLIELFGPEVGDFLFSKDDPVVVWGENVYQPSMRVSESSNTPNITVELRCENEFILSRLVSIKSELDNYMESDRRNPSVVTDLRVSCINTVNNEAVEWVIRKANEKIPVQILFRTSNCECKGKGEIVNVEVEDIKSSILVDIKLYKFEII